jgi:hypothetical protein
MIIPSGRRRQFVKDLIDQCNISQVDRKNRNAMMMNYWLCGGEDAGRAAMFNKTFAYLDDLQSLLYSPVSLRFHISDPDIPNILENAKGRASAAKLRGFERKSDTDTLISAGVMHSLVSGKSFIKSAYKRKSFHTTLRQSDCMGVRHENHDRLDEDMEAFCDTMYISFEQFARMVWNRKDRSDLIHAAKTRVISDLPPMQEAQRQIVTGGLYPFQPAGSATPNNSRGVVDWMATPKPTLEPSVAAKMLKLSELWVWDDEAEDWATFQMIGDDLLLLGENFQVNLFAFDLNTKESNPDLKGHHPYTEFCINPIDGYFWGRSEILNVALLQEMLSSRIDGVNRIIKHIEDPSYKGVGITGDFQKAMTRFRSPGGTWADQNPNAKVDKDEFKVDPALVGWIHEAERMFDEMGGLPPTARGHGEAGVRSHAHAETLVRMFSPRFKDRALLAERNVEALGSLHLDMARVHVDKKMLAWVPLDEAAGQELDKDMALMKPPSPGQVAVPFTFADLDDDVTLTIDAHSSSPAFAAEAKALTFDLFKIGAMSPEDVLDRSEVTDPEELIAGVNRRAVARAKAEQEAQVLKFASHAKK